MFVEWKWWYELSLNQQLGIYAFIPFLLFFTDLMIKSGFGLSIDTAGGDICLCSVGLDVSQTFITILNPIKETNILLLLIILTLIHFSLWVLCLRLVAFDKYSINPSISRTVRIGSSYFLGLVALYISLGTILNIVVK